jgi:hypothetical protein
MLHKQTSLTDFEISCCFPKHAISRHESREKEQTYPVYGGLWLAVALEADEGVIVGDAMVHVLGVGRAVRVGVRQVHARAVVVIGRARAAVRRLVVRFVTRQRARARTRA